MDLTSDLDRRIAPITKLELRRARGRSKNIWTGSAPLADAGKLRPLLYKQNLKIQDIGIAHDLVASGTLGKVVVEL